MGLLSADKTALITQQQSYDYKSIWVSSVDLFNTPFWNIWSLPSINMNILRYYSHLKSLKTSEPKVRAQKIVSKDAFCYDYKVDYLCWNCIMSKRSTATAENSKV